MAQPGDGARGVSATTAPRPGRRPAPLGATYGIGERLRRRLGLGLSLRQAADRGGLSMSFLSNVERGRRVPSFWTHEQLRSGLGRVDPARWRTTPVGRLELS